MKGRFIEVCNRWGLKVSGDESKVMALGRGGGLVCKLTVDGRRLEHVAEFICTRFIKQSPELSDFL